MKVRKSESHRALLIPVLLVLAAAFLATSLSYGGESNELTGASITGYSGDIITGIGELSLNIDGAYCNSEKVGAAILHECDLPRPSQYAFKTNKGIVILKPEELKYSIEDETEGIEFHAFLGFNTEFIQNGVTVDSGQYTIDFGTGFLNVHSNNKRKLFLAGDAGSSILSEDLSDQISFRDGKDIDNIMLHKLPFEIGFYLHAFEGDVDYVGSDKVDIQNGNIRLWVVPSVVERV